MLVFWQTVIHYLYFVIAAIIAFFLIKNFFKREKRTNLVYDIVYAYCVIPFVLRVLFVK